MVNMPRWQRFFILAIIAVAAFFAFPNTQYGRVEQFNDANIRIALDQAEPGDEELAQSWPSWLPSDLVNLGLDLRGGVHVVVQVKLEQVYDEQYNSLWATSRDLLREQSSVFGNVQRVPSDDGLVIKIENTEKSQEAAIALQNEANALGGNEFVIDVEGDEIHADLTETGKSAIDEITMARSLEIVRRRIDAAGTKEPTIAQQGEDRILIDVPGFGSVEEVLELLGRTAKLTLNPVIAFEENDDVEVSFDELILPSKDQGYVRIDRAAVVTGDMISDARLGFDPQTNHAQVNFSLNTEGAKAFGDYTSGHVGEPFAIILDDEVISAPRIQAYISSGRAMITGDFTPEEAENLAVLLRSGALPAELEVLEQSVVGPDLGQDSIDAGSLAAMIALAIVGIYMVFMYRLYGVFATMALIVNMILIVAALSLIGSVLTLPGIAGIVLTIGMAVDANVLIFERIREEYKIKPVLVRAVDQGFSRALSSILDANVTTFIAALVLYFLGAGPVRGFAITLMIGIATSVFTAVYGTRLFLVWYIDRRKPKILSFGERKSWLDNRHFAFMKNTKWFVRVSLLLMIASLALFFLRGPNYGIDFRGGTIFNVQVEQSDSVADVRGAVSTVFDGDISVTTYSGADAGMQGMFIRLSPDGGSAAMNEEEISLIKATMDQEFANSKVLGVDSIGGAVSGELVQKGLLSVFITLFAIGIYIWIRFEAAFSMGAIFALIHDVTLTLGFFVVTFLVFDLSVVAAILAIIGYSLNDTVVVYDRIREKFKTSKSEPLDTVIDRAVNETLSRTLMTSGTTLLAVLAILIFGGPELRSFSVAMLWGIFVGTYSSIFIASPILVRLGVQREGGRESRVSKFSNVDV